MLLVSAAILFVLFEAAAMDQDNNTPTQRQPQAQAEDVSLLEARYKTCAKHYIPADKCTLEIYQQWKDIDKAWLDCKTAAALGAVKEYRSRLRNSDSMQVHTAYVTDNGAVCLEIAGMNPMGRMSVSRLVYLTQSWPHRGDRSMDKEGFLGGLAADHSGNYHEDTWRGFCREAKLFGKGILYPGTDVTEKVNMALKDGSKSKIRRFMVCDGACHVQPIGGFSSRDWIFELKYDGFRALAEIEYGRCRLVSRNGNTFAIFQDLALKIGRLFPQDRAVLDGEIACLDGTGRPQFTNLLFHRGEPTFIAFDLLYYTGKDLRRYARSGADCLPGEEAP